MGPALEMCIFPMGGDNTKYGELHSERTFLQPLRVDNGWDDFRGLFWRERSSSYQGDEIQHGVRLEESLSVNKAHDVGRKLEALSGCESGCS